MVAFIKWYNNHIFTMKKKTLLIDYLTCTFVNMQSVTGAASLLMGDSNRTKINVFIQPVPFCLGLVSTVRGGRGCGIIEFLWFHISNKPEVMSNLSSYSFFHSIILVIKFCLFNFLNLSLISNCIISFLFSE